MLEEFLERNQTYNVRSEAVSERTVQFTLYNLNTLDVIQVLGVKTQRLHQKYKDELKNSVYSQYINSQLEKAYLIEGEIYVYNNLKFTKISGNTVPVLVQQLKTKTKIVANGYNDIGNFVRLMVINGNMKGTKEKKRADRPMVRQLRPGELGYKLMVNRNWDGRKYLSITGTQDDSIQYDLPKDQMKVLMRNNFIKVDENYHTVMTLPKELNAETIDATNKALLFEFGTRNNAPIFSVQLEQAQSLKGEKIC